MASRTYIPTLVRILRGVCIYITKYRATLEEHLNTEQKEKLALLMVACEAFLLITPLIVEN